MTLGEKLITIQKRLTRDIVSTFQQTGVDASLGLLILDGVRTDLMEDEFKSLLERSSLAQLEKNEIEPECPQG